MPLSIVPCTEPKSSSAVAPLAPHFGWDQIYRCRHFSVNPKKISTCTARFAPQLPYSLPESKTAHTRSQQILGLQERRQRGQHPWFVCYDVSPKDTCVRQQRSNSKRVRLPFSALVTAVWLSL